MSVVSSQAADKPLKVFILAGQSNMAGHGKVEEGRNPDYDPKKQGSEPEIIGGLGSLRRMVNNPATAAKYKHLVDAEGKWVVRDDAWIYSTTADNKKGKLSVGYGSNGVWIGPEFGFGMVVADHCKDPILIIKTAWGGKSLGVDFRPPSSGKSKFAGEPGDEGKCYREMIRIVKDVCANVETHFPELKGYKIEFAGFGWDQGWNDQYDPAMVAEYDRNMANLIKDVRKELNAPNLPFVITSTGQLGPGTAGDLAALCEIQMGMGDPKKHPEFKGTVASVETRGFARPAKESPSDFDYHWNHNGESHYLVGEAMGQAMVKLLEQDRTIKPSVAGAESVSNGTGVARIPIAALDTGKGNFFDSQSFDPSVLVNPEDPSQLIMFFSAMAAPVARGQQRIGRATANVSDPTVWTVSNGGKPMLEADAKSWDQEGSGMRCDSVLYNPADKKLYLYYSPGTHIGLATSSDLGLTWTKHPKPVLSPSKDESLNHQFAVMKDGGVWHGIYSYRTGDKILPAYRYATSTDGISWTKSGGDVYADPDGGRYHEFHQLFKLGSRYYLAYESGGDDKDWDIRIATSTDPEKGWTRSAVNPVFVKSGVAGTFDCFHVSTPWFINIKGKWWLFYSGARDHAQPYVFNHWPMGVISGIVPSP